MSDPHKFEIGDRVRNLALEKERTVIGFNGDTLTVRKDEAAGDKSHLWSWITQNCLLIHRALKVGDYATVGDNPAVGKITNERVHSNGVKQLCLTRPNPNGGSNMTHWISDFALCPAPAPSDAFNLKVTDDSAQISPTFNYAPDVAGWQQLITSIQFSQEYLDQTTESGNMGASSAARIAELERQLMEWQRKAETLRAESVGLQSRVQQLEAMLMHPQPVAVRQSTCVEIKTLDQSLRVSDVINKADRELAEAVNAGWVIEHIAIIDNFSFDGSSGGSYPQRFVTLKRTTATQPIERAPAGAHATLTGDYVRKSIAPDAILEPSPVEEQPLSMLGAVRIFGAQTVGAQMDKLAVQNAMRRRQQRGAPVYAVAMPLLPVKAGE